MALEDLFFNPMMGQLDEKAKDAIMRRALLTGSLGMMSAGAQGQPFGQGLATGGMAMMGTADQMVDAGLKAQLGTLQRKNIESQMQAREEAAGRGQQQLKLQQERLKMQREAAQRQAEQQSGRGESAEFIRAMMGGDATEEELAGAIMQHQLQYGGGIPGNVQNVLMPGGIRQSPLDAMMAAMMGIGPDTAPTGQPGAQPTPQPTAPVGTTSKKWIEDTLGIKGGEKALASMGAADSLAAMKKLEQSAESMSPAEQQQAARLYSILGANIVGRYRSNLIGKIQR